MQTRLKQLLTALLMVCATCLPAQDYPNGQYTLGRHTLIEPMRYTADGWFVPDTTRSLPDNAVSHTATGCAANDDFSTTEPDLQWMGWRENPMRHLGTGNGKLHPLPLPRLHPIAKAPEPLNIYKVNFVFCSFIHIFMASPRRYFHSL